MIKIIQFASQSGLGGGQKIIFNIVNGLNDKVKFIIMVPAGMFFKKYSQMGIKVKELKKLNLIKTIREIRNFIRRETSEIIHLHGTRAATLARLAVIGLRNKPKVVYTLHGFHIVRRNFFVRWLLLIIERFLNRWTDILVCVSESDKNLVLKYKTIPDRKIFVIKNGIDIERFQVNQEKIENVKKELKLEKSFILISIGRLHFQKDFSTILKALKPIVTQIPEVRLLIVGDGPLRKLLEKEATDLVLNKYVKFLGFREDTPILINLSDIVILSTKWEGLPLVPLETGASKKPIIASDIDGLRETIIDGKTGFLFQPSSEKDLIEKILKLFKSEQLRKQLGENAYLFVSKNFNNEKMINSYFSLYKDLVEERI
jgi:glycosyltransferase involved in cell wall biosynthesis